MKNDIGLVGLRAIRKERKLNQLKVALDLNISREALSHYENGKSVKFKSLKEGDSLETYLDGGIVYSRIEKIKENKL